MSSMRSNFIKTGLSVVMALLFFTTCSEDIGDNYVTFEEDTIFSFLEKQPEQYSEFLALLETSGVSSLMKAYGQYTLFAPTNEAILNYYEENNTSRDQISTEDIRELVFNHLLPVILLSIEFPQGMLPTANLSEKFLNITYSSDDNVSAIYINDRSRVLILDQVAHNGIIHTVDNIIHLSKIQLPDVIGLDPRFTLFSEALFATGMSDSLRIMDDKDYVTGSEKSRKRNETNLISYPPFRKLGVTAFVESDSTFALHGINNLDELKAFAAQVYDEMYPEDKGITDVKNRHNSLNRFVAYHLMNRMQAANEFLHKAIEDYYNTNAVVNAYIEMMAPNTLLEVQMGKWINKRKDGSAITFLSANNEAMNGLYHEISDILTYDVGMETDVLNKRIRIDFATMMPEMTTNKLRLAAGTWILPHGYCSNIVLSEGTQLQYIPGPHNYEWDEVLPSGRYDFTVRMPPIPAGTYEIRYGYSPYQDRGIGQIYFDGIPQGIPLNNSFYADNPKIGWVQDRNTDDDGIENDKMMRNRGYLKGPTCILTNSRTMTARDDSWCLRKILKIETFDKMEPHTFRVKCVEEKDKEFHLDYMEFIPVALMDKEGRD
jgi:uncharacterized surface protein with fasciclin (FAS1) repeats